MIEGLMIIEALSAMLAFGLNITESLQRVSDLVKKRHDENATVTRDDLLTLFRDGDELEAKAREKFDLAARKLAVARGRRADD